MVDIVNTGLASSPQLIDAEKDNSVSTLESIFAGIGSGLIQIQKVHFH